MSIISSSPRATTNVFPIQKGQLGPHFDFELAETTSGDNENFLEVLLQINSSVRCSAMVECLIEACQEIYVADQTLDGPCRCFVDSVSFSPAIAEPSFEFPYAHLQFARLQFSLPTDSTRPERPQVIEIGCCHYSYRHACLLVNTPAEPIANDMRRPHSARIKRKRVLL